MLPLPRQIHLGPEGWDAALSPSPPIPDFGADHVDGLLERLEEMPRRPGLEGKSFAGKLMLASTFKPQGGFWTSSEGPNCGRSEWESMALNAGLGPRPGELFVFEVSGAPRILELTDDGDVAAAMREVGLDGELSGASSSRFWQVAAGAWDAVRVLSRHSRAGLLHYWDVESTVWFRPDLHLRYAERRPFAAKRRR